MVADVRGRGKNEKDNQQSKEGEAGGNPETNQLEWFGDEQWIPIWGFTIAFASIHHKMGNGMRGFGVKSPNFFLKLRDFGKNLGILHF